MQDTQEHDHRRGGGRGGGGGGGGGGYEIGYAGAVMSPR